MELAPADRPAAQLGRDIDRALIAPLGHQPEAPLAYAQGVLYPGLETERRIKRHDLGPTVEAAVAAAAELDLARERDQPSRCSAIRLQPAAAGGTARRRREGRLESSDQLVSEPDPVTWTSTGTIHSIVSPSRCWRV